MISLVVARDRNGAIGKGNDIPWHVREDLASFMRETLGGALIMGRNTWDSLPVKPLKSRMNIVVSSKGVDHEHVVPSLDAALALAASSGYARVYGVGGAGIYAAMLPIADRLLITEVDLDVDGADTFFPTFDPAQWRENARHELCEDAPRCTRVEYLRR